MALSQPPPARCLHFFLLWGLLQYRTSLAGEPVRFYRATQHITGVGELAPDAVAMLWRFINGFSEQPMIEAQLLFNDVPATAQVSVFST
jgi:hypothetical protein